MAHNTIEGRRQVGKYRVVRELGRGGMALVYLAEEADTGRRVALKVLPPTMVDRAAVARFHREGRVAARIVARRSVEAAAEMMVCSVIPQPAGDELPLVLPARLGGDEARARLACQGSAAGESAGDQTHYCRRRPAAP